MQYLDAISKMVEWTQVYALTTNAEKAEVEGFYEDLQDLLVPGPCKKKKKKKPRPFNYRGLECKSKSQEISRITGKFGLGVQNEEGQRLIEFCQENALVIVCYTIVPFQ